MADNDATLVEIAAIKKKSNGLVERALDCTSRENWETVAIPLLRQAIEINPMNEQAYCELGFALSRMGESQESIRILKHVLSFSPKHKTARQLLERAEELAEQENG